MGKSFDLDKALQRKARAKARQAKGSLRHCQVSEGVLKRYIEAACLLRTYWQMFDVDAILDANFDFQMAGYIEHLYQ